MRIRVVGIGTQFGDDAAGPLVAQRLAAGGTLPGGVEAVPCRQPLDLLDLLDGLDGAVLVDAMRSGRLPGTVHEPAFHELDDAQLLSSHGLGVREALALAQTLGRAPQRIALIGIEAGAANGGDMSPSVRVALAEAAVRARRRCEAWVAGAGAPAHGAPRHA